MRNRSRIGYLQSILSIAANTLLFGLKIWAGIRINSIALIADAWHTLSDSFSSLILLLGFKIAAKPPDRRHPFGHGRAELIAAVVIGTILMLIGFNFLIEVIKRFRENLSIEFDLTAKLVLLVSILLKSLIAAAAFKLAKLAGSELIRADGWHHLSDALTSVVILAGIFLSPRIWWIDNLLGALLSLILFYASFKILSRSVSHLLGEDIETGTEKKLRELLEDRFRGLIVYHHLHCHNYGDHREVTFHINMPSSLTLAQVHRIVDMIENLIRNEIGLEATVHVDPDDRDKTLFKDLL